MDSKTIKFIENRLVVPRGRVLGEGVKWVKVVETLKRGLESQTSFSVHTGQF